MIVSNAISPHSAKSKKEQGFCDPEHIGSVVCDIPSPVKMAAYFPWTVIGSKVQAEDTEGERSGVQLVSMRQDKDYDICSLDKRLTRSMCVPHVAFQSNPQAVLKVARLIMSFAEIGLGWVREMPMRET